MPHWLPRYLSDIFKRQRLRHFTIYIYMFIVYKTADPLNLLYFPPLNYKSSFIIFWKLCLCQPHEIINFPFHNRMLNQLFKEGEVSSNIQGSNYDFYQEWKSKYYSSLSHYYAIKSRSLQFGGIRTHDLTAVNVFNDIGNFQFNFHGWLGILEFPMVIWELSQTSLGIFEKYWNFPRNLGTVSVNLVTFPEKITTLRRLIWRSLTWEVFNL